MTQHYLSMFSLNEIKNVIYYVKLIFALFFYFPDELVNEKEKFKAISDELDQTFAEMSGY